jgi:hypothetical protein
MQHDPPEPTIQALETSAAEVVGKDWCSKLDKTFTSSLGKYRKYKGNSVRDLLRAMRNKVGHDHSSSVHEGGKLTNARKTTTKIWNPQRSVTWVHCPLDSCCTLQLDIPAYSYTSTASSRDHSSRRKVCLYPTFQAKNNCLLSSHTYCLRVHHVPFVY